MVLAGWGSEGGGTRFFAACGATMKVSLTGTRENLTRPFRCCADLHGGGAESEDAFFRNPFTFQVKAGTVVVRGPKDQVHICVLNQICAVFLSGGVKLNYTRDFVQVARHGGRCGDSGTGPVEEEGSLEILRTNGAVSKLRGSISASS